MRETENKKMPFQLSIQDSFRRNLFVHPILNNLTNGNYKLHHINLLNHYFVVFKILYTIRYTLAANLSFLFQQK